MRTRISATGKYATLVIGCLAALIPLVVVVLTAFKTKQDFATSGPLDLPTSFTTANFVEAFFHARKSPRG